jgi:hypothetical protein
MANDNSNWDGQAIELVKTSYLTPIITTLQNPDVGDLPKEVAIFGRFLEGLQHIIDSRKVYPLNKPDEVRENMVSHLSWFLQYLRDRQRNPAPSPDRFASSATYFYEFVKSFTTASPEEIEGLRQTYEHLSKGDKDEPRPVYTQRNVVSSGATSHQFIGTRQTNNTGNGLQINGNVRNLHDRGARNQS